MGIHLSIVTLDHKPHPAWDTYRHAGDRHVMEIIEANGGTVQHPAPGDYDPWKHGDDIYYRPADFDALAAATWPEENPDRWALLQRILRDESNYWLFASY